MKVSLIIPHYNRWDLLEKRLLEIKMFLSHDVEVVISDDASTKPNIGFYEGMKMGGDVIWRVWNENKGFPANCNRGATMATGDIFIFLSTDVVISGDFISQIKRLIEANPVSFIGGVVHSFDTGWNKVDGKIIPYAEGWLIACKREVWEALGGFDEQFSPFDYEDVDISLRAVQAGYVLIALNSDYLNHAFGVTIRSEIGDDRRRMITEINRNKFLNKWSGRI